MNLSAKIESILFVASKPLDFKTIARAVGKNEMEVAEAVEILKMRYNQAESGIHILQTGDNIQMMSNAENSGVVDIFIKDEISEELTRAQLETLTVIAYRGPLTRPELEQIRGVNCALILRNLLVRGLVEEKEASDKITSVYTLSFEALRHLGIISTTELPNFEILHKHDNIERILAEDEALDLI